MKRPDSRGATGLAGRLARRMGRGDRHLRRVSPEKARAVAAAKRANAIPQRAEKACVAAVAGAGAVLLLGLGTLDKGRAWLALGVVITVLTAGFLRHLGDFRREGLGSLSRVAGLAVLLLLPLVGLATWEHFAGPVRLEYLPLAFVTLVLALVWGRQLAVDGTVLMAGLLLLYLALRERLTSPGLDGLVIAFGGGLAAALVSEGIKRRGTLVRVGLVVGCVQAILAGAVLLLGDADPEPAYLWEMLRIGIAGAAVGVVVSGLLPWIEALFDVTTDISLLELGNTNEAPLLRKLLIEAAGTFHHSYVVGLLAEASAEAIGANALLARVGALYHDVGKLNKPEYFAENSPGARERHKGLAPEMSMLVISAHTRDGVELGRYYGLPRAILDFMTEHHGTCCVEYFYHRAKELRGAESVSDANFRYPGSKPRSRETAIVMIADAVEAIGRQMPDPSRPRLEEMVHSVVHKRLMDGQFSECGITLGELSSIESACVQVMSAIHHTRPTFPKGKPHPLDLSQPRAAADPGGGGGSLAASRSLAGGRR